MCVTPISLDAGILDQFDSHRKWRDTILQYEPNSTLGLFRASLWRLIMTECNYNGMRFTYPGWAITMRSAAPLTENKEQ